MTLVSAADHIYYVAAAYAVAATGLGGLVIATWRSARHWNRQAETLRQDRISDDT
jgi:Heme exporter protein D (CcmD)